jgi:hypothetical protein
VGFYARWMLSLTGTCKLLRAAEVKSEQAEHHRRQSTDSFEDSPMEPSLAVMHRNSCTKPNSTSFGPDFTSRT